MNAMGHGGHMASPARASGPGAFKDFFVMSLGRLLTGRVITGKARGAVGHGCVHHFEQSFGTDKSKSVRANELTDFVNAGGGRGDELRPFGGVDSKVAWVTPRRRADPEVNLLCARVADHIDDFAAGGSANNRIVDYNN